MLVGQVKLEWNVGREKPRTPVAELESLLKPYPAEVMRVAAKSILNSPKRDGPECLEAA